MTQEQPKVNLTGHYNVNDTCNALQIHRSTLLRYVEQGLIKPYYHKTGKKYYTGSEIMRFWGARL